MAYPFTGGGDGLAPGVLPAGGGDYLPRLGLGGGDYLTRVLAAIPFDLTSASDMAELQQEDGAFVIGEEGGYFLQLSTPLENYFRIDPTLGPIPHIIDLIDSTGQEWPLYTPACYGAVPTLGHVLVPRAGGRVLRFASPHAPEGLYSLRVRRPTEGWEAIMPRIRLRVIPQPFSREVNSVRAAFPIEVYNPYPD